MDETQAEYLVDRYADMLVRIGYTWFSNRDDAQDLCQTVLLKLLEHPRVFPDEGQERAWVIRMAVNVCKNLKKSAWFRRTVGLEEGLHLTVQVPPEEESEVLPLVQQLPLKYRRVLYLRYYEGYQVGEIAALLGVRPALVSTHLTRARAKLKIMLEDEGYGKTIPE